MHLLFLATAYPLWRFLCANAKTSLRSAAYWTVVAWAGWGSLIISTAAGFDKESLEQIRFLVLCLTACAGVAVLGARRPHVGAWSFVVLGFLAVMALPLVEHRVLGTPLLSGLRAWFLGGILILTVLNYVPTRFGLAAVLVGIGCVDEIVQLAAPDWYLRYRMMDPSLICLTVAPWAGFIRRLPRDLSESNALWLDFRDRYGLLWGLRVREQFNAAMQNAGLPVRLSWGGLVPLPDSLPPSEDQSAAARETLRALLKRFVPAA